MTDGPVLQHVKQIMTAREIGVWPKWPDGYYYQGVEDLILREGKDYPSQRLSPKERVWTTVVIDLCLLRMETFNRTFEQKACFFNAQFLADFAYHYGIPPGWTFDYVEGLTFGSVIVCNHAWCVMNGKVIDVTWRQVHEELDKPFRRENSYLGVHDLDYRGVVLVPPVMVDMGASLLDDWKNKWPILKQKLGECEDPGCPVDHNIRAGE